MRTVQLVISISLQSPMHYHSHTGHDIETTMGDRWHSMRRGFDYQGYAEQEHDRPNELQQMGMGL